MRDYLKQTEVIHPPYVAEKFGVYIDKVYRTIADLWDHYENPHVVNNLIYTNYENKKWVYEVCDTPYKRGRYKDIKDIQSYWKQNQRDNQHYSMFAHDENWVDNVKGTGSVSCNNTMLYAPVLWVEMDRKDYNKVPDLQKALDDGTLLQDRIRILTGKDTSAWCFTSGNNSSHVAINGSLFGNPIVDQGNVNVFYRLALRLTKDIRFNNGINDPYLLNEPQLKNALEKVYPDLKITKWDSQLACSALENLDPNLYRTNSLIRQPWSFHEATGKPKELVDPLIFTLEQHKPTLLKYWFEAWEFSQIKSKKQFDLVYESSYIVDKYKPYYPDIDMYKPDANNWVGPFHSVLYDDSNPAVYINMENGFHQDFGNAYHSVTMNQFLKRVTNG
jgi:hypothetical protein